MTLLSEPMAEADTIQIANCDRCGVRLKVGPAPNPDAKLLKRATAPKGVCVNCAVTIWFRGVPELCEIMDNPRCHGCGGYRREHYGAKICRCEKPQMSTPQDMISLPHVQAIFAQILLTGGSDAKPDEIDWLEVAANWDLPLPEKRKTNRGKKPPKQTELF